MRILRYLLLIGLPVVLLYSCAGKDSNNNDALFPVQNKLWADTITYEVLIMNPDSANEWESTKIKNVKRQLIVDDLFRMIYNGEKKAYNYYTDEALTINDVKAIEKESDFSRDKVGKLQFTETWNMDIANFKMHKEVLSILLAYELYNDSNQLRGYKAAFYLKDF